MSEYEGSLPQDIDFRGVLGYEGRQRLYERRLELTKALPIMLREMTQLEDDNQEQIALYIRQKSEFTAGLCMLIDQIDNVLQKDDDHQQTI